MKKLLKNKILLFFCFLLSAFYFLSEANAAGLVPCSGINCKWCDLFKMVENILVWARDISLPLAALFIAYGGFIMMFAAGSVDKLGKGKKIITSAIVGVVIILVSYLILDIIFQILSGGSSGIGPWNKIECNPPPAL